MSSYLTNTFLNLIKNQIVSELEKRLKQFVDISKNDIDVELGEKGHLELKNVRIKPDALAESKIPLQVVDGTVDSISIEVPTEKVMKVLWNTLFTTKNIDEAIQEIGTIQITISGVTFSVKPYETLDFDTKTNDERKPNILSQSETADTLSLNRSNDLQTKETLKKEIEAANKRFNDRLGLEQEKSAKIKSEAADTFFRNRLNDRAVRWDLPFDKNIDDGANKRSAFRIVSILFARLLEIQVEHVHIKYSDSISNPQSPFQLGILLEQFHFGRCMRPCCAKSSVATSTNASDTPTPIQPSLPIQPTSSSLTAASSVPSSGLEDSSSNTAKISKEEEQKTQEAIVRSTDNIHFNHNIVKWNGLYVYIIPLKDAYTPASIPSALSDGSDDENIVYKISDIPSNVEKVTYLQKLTSIAEWSKLHIPVLQFIIRDISGAVTLSRHLLKTIVSSDDPPSNGIDVYIENLHIELRESQFAHLRALSSYKSHVARFARYKSIPRPENKHVPLLTTEQHNALREYLYIRRIHYYYKEGMAKQLSAIPKAEEQEQNQSTVNGRSNEKNKEDITGVSFTTNSDTNVDNLTGIIDDGDDETDTVKGKSSEVNDIPADSTTNVPPVLPVLSPSAAINSSSKKEYPEEILILVKDNLPPIPEDPYTLISAELKKTINDRARAWCNFAKACVLRDIREITRKSVQDSLPKVKIREKYIEEFRHVWDEVYGPLIIPPIVLPSFSIINVVSQSAIGTITNTPVKTTTSKRNVPSSSTNESSSSPSRWYSEWVADFPSENIPAHVVDLKEWEAYTGTKIVSASANTTNTSSSFRFPFFGRKRRKNPPEVTVSPVKSPDSVVGSPATGNVLSIAPESSTTGITTYNENSTGTDKRKNDGAVDSTESTALQRIRKYEETLTLEEILQFRLLAETKLITEYIQKLQRKRQEHAMRTVASIARSASRSIVTKILRSVLQSYITSTIAGMSLTDENSNKTMVLKETFARILSQQRTHNVQNSIKLSDLLLPLRFSNSVNTHFLMKQTTNSLSSSLSESNSYYNDFFTFGQSKNIINLTTSYIRKEEEKSSNATSSLLSDLKKSTHYPKVRNLDDNEDNDDETDEDDTMDKEGNTVPSSNTNFSTSPNKNGTNVKPKGLLKGIRMLFSPSTSSIPRSSKNGSPVKKEIRTTIFGTKKETKYRLQGSTMEHTSYQVPPEELDDHGDSNSDDVLWGADNLMCVSPVIGLWVMLGLHPTSTNPQNFSSTKTNTSQPPLTHGRNESIHPTLEPVPIEIYCNSRFALTESTSLSSSDETNNNNIVSTAPASMESSSMSFTPVYQYSEPTSLQYIKWYSSQILSSQPHPLQTSLGSQLKSTYLRQKEVSNLYGNYLVKDGMTKNDVRVMLDAILYNKYTEEDVGLPINFVSLRLAINISKISVLIKSQHVVSDLASKMTTVKSASNVYNSVVPKINPTEDLLLLSIEDISARICRIVGTYSDVYLNIGSISVDNPSAVKIVPYSFYRLNKSSSFSSASGRKPILGSSRSITNDPSPSTANVDLSIVLRMDSNTPSTHALVPKINLPTPEQLLRDEHWSRYWTIWLQQNKLSNVIKWVKLWQYSTVYSLVDTNRQLDIMKDIYSIMEEDAKLPTVSNVPQPFRSFDTTDSFEYASIPLSPRVKQTVIELSKYILAGPREQAGLSRPNIDEHTLMILVYRELLYKIQTFANKYIKQEWCLLHNTFRHQCEMLRRSNCLTATMKENTSSSLSTPSSSDIPHYNPCTIIYVRTRLHEPLSLINADQKRRGRSSHKASKELYGASFMNNKEKILSLQTKLTSVKSMREMIKNRIQSPSGAQPVLSNEYTTVLNHEPHSLVENTNNKAVEIPDLYGNWWSKELPFFWSPGKLIPMKEQSKTDPKIGTKVEHKMYTKVESDENIPPTLLWKVGNNDVQSMNVQQNLVLRSAFVAVQLPSVDSLQPQTNHQRKDIDYILTVSPHVFSHSDAILTLRKLQKNNEKLSQSLPHTRSSHNLPVQSNRESRNIDSRSLPRTSTSSNMFSATSLSQQTNDGSVWIIAEAVLRTGTNHFQLCGRNSIGDLVPIMNIPLTGQMEVVSELDIGLSSTVNGKDIFSQASLEDNLRENCGWILRSLSTMHSPIYFLSASGYDRDEWIRTLQNIIEENQSIEDIICQTVTKEYHKVTKSPTDGLSKNEIEPELYIATSIAPMNFTLQPRLIESVYHFYKRTGSHFELSKKKLMAEHEQSIQDLRQQISKYGIMEEFHDSVLPLLSWRDRSYDNDIKSVANSISAFKREQIRLNLITGEEIRAMTAASNATTIGSPTTSVVSVERDKQYQRTIKPSNLPTGKRIILIAADNDTDEQWNKNSDDTEEETVSIADDNSFIGSAGSFDGHSEDDGDDKEYDVYDIHDSIEHSRSMENILAGSNFESSHSLPIPRSSKRTLNKQLSNRKSTRYLGKKTSNHEVHLTKTERMWLDYVMTKPKKYEISMVLQGVTVALPIVLPSVMDVEEFGTGSLNDSEIPEPDKIRSFEKSLLKISESVDTIQPLLGLTFEKEIPHPITIEKYPSKQLRKLPSLDRPQRIAQVIVTLGKCMVQSANPESILSIPSDPALLSVPLPYADCYEGIQAVVTHFSVHMNDGSSSSVSQSSTLPLLPTINIPGTQETREGNTVDENDTVFRTPGNPFDSSLVSSSPSLPSSSTLILSVARTTVAGMRNREENTSTKLPVNVVTTDIGNVHIDITPSVLRSILILYDILQKELFSKLDTPVKTSTQSVNTISSPDESLLDSPNATITNAGTNSNGVAVTNSSVIRTSSSGTSTVTNAEKRSEDLVAVTSKISLSRRTIIAGVLKTIQIQVTDDRVSTTANDTKIPKPELSMIISMDTSSFRLLQTSNDSNIKLSQLSLCSEGLRVYFLDPLTHQLKHPVPLLVIQPTIVRRPAVKDSHNHHDNVPQSTGINNEIPLVSEKKALSDENTLLTTAPRVHAFQIGRATPTTVHYARPRIKNSSAKISGSTSVTLSSSTIIDTDYSGYSGSCQLHPQLDQVIELLELKETFSSMQKNVKTVLDDHRKRSIESIDKWNKCIEQYEKYKQSRMLRKKTSTNFGSPLPNIAEDSASPLSRLPSMDDGEGMERFLSTTNAVTSSNISYVPHAIRSSTAPPSMRPVRQYPSSRTKTTATTYKTLSVLSTEGTVADARFPAKFPLVAEAVSTMLASMDTSQTDGSNLYNPGVRSYLPMQLQQQGSIQKDTDDLFYSQHNRKYEEIINNTTYIRARLAQLRTLFNLPPSLTTIPTSTSSSSTHANNKDTKAQKSEDEHIIRTGTRILLEINEIHGRIVQQSVSADQDTKRSRNNFEDTKSSLLPIENRWHRPIMDITIRHITMDTMMDNFQNQRQSKVVTAQPENSSLTLSTVSLHSLRIYGFHSSYDRKYIPKYHEPHGNRVIKSDSQFWSGQPYATVVIDIETFLFFGGTNKIQPSKADKIEQINTFESSGNIRNENPSDTVITNTSAIVTSVAKNAYPDVMNAYIRKIQVATEPNVASLPDWARQRFYSNDATMVNPKDTKGVISPSSNPKPWEWLPGSNKHLPFVRSIVRFEALRRIRPIVSNEENDDSDDEALPKNLSSIDQEKNRLRMSIPVADTQDIVNHFHDSLFSWQPSDTSTTTTNNSNNRTNGINVSINNNSTDSLIFPISISRFTFPKVNVTETTINNNNIDALVPETLGGADTFTRIETGGFMTEADPLCVLTLLEWIDNSVKALESVTKKSSSTSSSIPSTTEQPSSPSTIATNVSSLPVWDHIGIHIPQGIVRLYAIGNGIISEAAGKDEIEKYTNISKDLSYVHPFLCNGIVIPHSEILFGGLYIQNDMCKQPFNNNANLNNNNRSHTVNFSAPKKQLSNAVMHIRAVYLSMVDISPSAEDVLYSASSSVSPSSEDGLPRSVSLVDVLRLVDNAWLNQENELLKDNPQSFGKDSNGNFFMDDRDKPYEEWKDRIVVLSEAKSLALQHHEQRVQQEKGATKERTDHPMGSSEFLSGNGSPNTLVDISLPLQDINHPWRVLLAPIPITREKESAHIHVTSSVPLPVPIVEYSNASVIHGYSGPRRTNVSDNHSVQSSKSKVQFLDSFPNNGLSGKSVAGRSVGTYRSTIGTTVQSQLLTAKSSEKFIQIPTWYLLRASARTISHTRWLSELLASTYKILNPVEEQIESDGEDDENNLHSNHYSQNDDKRSKYSKTPSLSRPKQNFSSSSVASASFLSPGQRMRASTMNASSSQNKMNNTPSTSRNPPPYRRNSLSTNQQPNIAGPRSVRALSVVRGLVKNNGQNSTSGRPILSTVPHDTSIFEHYSLTDYNQNIPSGYLLHRYFTMSSMLLVTVTQPFKVQILSEEAMAEKKQKDEDKRAKLVEFGDKVLQAERLFAEEGAKQSNAEKELPTPSRQITSLNPIETNMSSHTRIWLSDCSFVYFKRWVDETKGITASLKAPMEKENIWIASFLPRHASFDHSVTDISNIRVIMPSSSRKVERAIIVVLSKASVRNQLFYINVNSLEGTSANTSGRDNTDYSSNVYHPNNKMTVGGYSSARRNSTAGHNEYSATNTPNLHTNGSSVNVLSNSSLGKMITVPLERYAVEAVGVHFAIAESFTKREFSINNPKLSDIPKLPGLPPRFTAIPTDVMLSSIVDLNEGSDWLSACNSVYSGTILAENASFIPSISIPLLESTQLGTGLSLLASLDSPIGAAYRVVSPLKQLTNITIANGLHVAGLQEQITTMQEIQKENSKEENSLLHLLPELDLPSFTHTYINVAELRVSQAEVAKNRFQKGRLIPQKYIINKSSSSITANSSVTSTNYGSIDNNNNNRASLTAMATTTVSSSSTSMYAKAIENLSPLLQILFDPNNLPSEPSSVLTEELENNRSNRLPTNSTKGTANKLITTPRGANPGGTLRNYSWIKKSLPPQLSSTLNDLAKVNKTLSDIQAPVTSTNARTVDRNNSIETKVDDTQHNRERMVNAIQSYVSIDTLQRISNVLQVFSSPLPSSSASTGLPNSTNENLECVKFLSTLLQYTKKYVETMDQENKSIIAQQNENTSLLLDYITNQQDKLRTLEQAYNQLLNQRGMEEEADEYGRPLRMDTTNEYDGGESPMIPLPGDDDPSLTWNNNSVIMNYENLEGWKNTPTTTFPLENMDPSLASFSSQRIGAQRPFSPVGPLPPPGESLTVRRSKGSSSKGTSDIPPSSNIQDTERIRSLEQRINQWKRISIGVLAVLFGVLIYLLFR